MWPDAEEVFWALAGNLVIGFGAGTATLAAFAPTLPVVDGTNPVLRVGTVSIGFAFFFAGYRLSQTGTHRDHHESLAAAFVPDQLPWVGANGGAGSVDPFVVVRGVFLVLGIVGLGTGMRLFALTIQSWSATLGVACGVVCITGYVFGHIGMNGVVL